MSFANPILGGDSNLIRQAIKSPNYAAATDGWTINKDGTAEFNNATVRGSVSAGSGTVLLNAGGLNIHSSVTGKQSDININAQFLARLYPDDGQSKAQLVVVGGLGTGGEVLLNAVPSSVPGITFNDGKIIVSRDDAGGDSTPRMSIFPPGIPGKALPTIILSGGNTTLNQSDINLQSDVTRTFGDLQVGGQLDYGSAGSVPKDQIGSTANGNTNSATFQNTLNVTGTHGTVFIAPPSGSVYVSVSCVAGNNTAGSYSIMDWEIRDGNVIGSGSIWRGANENTAAVHQSSTANSQGSLSSFGIATGLTPGATYNAYLCYHVGSGGTSSYNRRHIAVIPMPNA